MIMCDIHNGLWDDDSDIHNGLWDEQIIVICKGKHEMINHVARPT